MYNSFVFDSRQVERVRAIGALVFSNPFAPERIVLERRILGSRFHAGPPVWSVDPIYGGNNPNVVAITELAEELLIAARAQVMAGRALSVADRELYEGLALYVLYYRHQAALYFALAEPDAEESAEALASIYDHFARDYHELFGEAPAQFLRESPAELYALYYQHRRAFHFTFRYILGTSLVAGRLRAAVWQSVFTHDIQRYRAGLITRMQEIATLIMGPSGTGKELAAQAIGLSRHIPFDQGRRRFAANFRDGFLPLNLAALSPTVIESELFGHKKGAFTGAIADRVGYFDRQEPWSTVFLDELGEIESGLQLKLLRLVQTREFQRLGENTTRQFGGKIIAATNLNLPDEIAAKRFRADLYFRLCSDVIPMPSLHEQIREQPGELAHLIRLFSQRVAGESLGLGLADEVTHFVEHSLSPDYTWPGNMRELEQCVRNVLVRRHYAPPAAQGGGAGEARQKLAEDVGRGRLTARQLLSCYCTLVYAEERSYEAAAKRLGLDRRTVKAYVDHEQVEAFDARGARV